MVLQETMKETGEDQGLVLLFSVSLENDWVSYGQLMKLLPSAAMKWEV
jgi:hypothetical protein